MTFGIYNSKYELVDLVTLDSANKESTGIYFYDLTLPEEGGDYIYEWTGVFAGKEVKERRRIRAKFINN